MQKLLFIPFLVLLISGGCITINVPDSNDDDVQGQAPVAYIDSVEPSTASKGQAVTFTGHGTDADGIVVGYKWQSSKDGVLSTVESFTITSLSAGTHTITFRVLDDKQNWSLEATVDITVTEAVSKPTISSFKASPSSIVQGGSSQLQWQVTGAQTVAIDNGIGQVTASGTITVNPSATTVFTLTAKNQGGSITSTATVNVQQAVVTGNPVIDFTAQYMGGNSWQLNWNVQNSTERVIEPDIGTVEPTGSAVVTVPSGQTVTYRLTATNSWGWAYWQVILAQP